MIEPESSIEIRRALTATVSEPNWSVLVGHRVLSAQVPLLHLTTQALAQPFARSTAGGLFWEWPPLTLSGEQNQKSEVKHNSTKKKNRRSKTSTKKRRRCARWIWIHLDSRVNNTSAVAEEEREQLEKWLLLLYSVPSSRAEPVSSLHIIPSQLLWEGHHYTTSND